MTQRWIGCVVAATVVLLTQMAVAAPRVAIVVNPDSGQPTGYETHLRSELEAAGFEVVLVPATAGAPDQLEAIAVQSDSVAAISLAQPQGAVSASVWVTERITGKTLLRAVRPEKQSAEAPSIIALRAVELLRASLLELNEPHAPRGEVLAPPSLRAWVAPTAQTPVPPASRPPAWGIAVGPGLLASPGGLPVAIAPSLGLLWRPTPALTGEFRWEGPFLATVDSPIGSASVSQEFLTFRARYEPLSSETRFSPWGALGLGGHHLAVHGSAESPYVGGKESGYGLVALVGLGLRIRLRRDIYLSPEGNAVVAAARPVVRFADRSRASTGRPWMSATVSLEYAW